MKRDKGDAGSSPTGTDEGSTPPFPETLTERTDDCAQAKSPSSRFQVQIPDYECLREIGSGGFGIVYQADQIRPVRRKVALKVLKRGLDTRQVVARFRAEQQALAMMDHPGIATVYDAGETEDGLPYFAMELIPHGSPVSIFCDEEKLSLDDRLQLFANICQAIHHAHQKGVIHRDIKPSNILVTKHEGKPIAKIIDFGIAKALEDDLPDGTLRTLPNHTPGTPAYMSPEQAAGDRDIDTRSDIYSLGILLYELLTGCHPLGDDRTSRDYDRIKRSIREDRAHRPSSALSTLSKDKGSIIASERGFAPNKLRSALRRDLDWITMMALEKDREKRYDSAACFAQDIARYRAHEPVTAAAPSVSYQLSKFARRHWAPLSVVGAITGLAFVGVSLAVHLTSKARATELVTEVQGALAYGARERGLALLENPVQGRLIERRSLAAALLALPGGFTAHQSPVETMPPDELLEAFGSKSAESVILFSNDKRRVAIVTNDTLVRVFESKSQKLIAELHSQGQDEPYIPASRKVSAVAFSSDGRLLAVGSLESHHVMIWQIDDGRLRGVLYHPSPVGALHWINNDRILTGTRTPELFEWEHLPEDGNFADSPVQHTKISAQSPILSLDSRPSDGAIAILTSTEAMILNGKTHEIEVSAELTNHARHRITIDEQFLTVHVSDNDSHQTVEWLPTASAHTIDLGAQPTQLTFCPGNQHAIVLSNQSEMLMIDLYSAQVTDTTPAQHGYGLAVCEADGTLYHLDRSGLHEWKLNHNQWHRQKSLIDSGASKAPLALSLLPKRIFYPQGNTMHIIDAQERIEILQKRLEFSSPVSHLTASPNGDLLAVRHKQSCSVYALEAESPVHVFNDCVSAQFVEDGNAILTLDSGGYLHCHSTKDWKEYSLQSDVRVGRIAATNERLLVSGSSTGKLNLFDYSSLRKIADLQYSEDIPVSALHLSSDGAVAVAVTETKLIIWKLHEMNHILEKLDLDWRSAASFWEPLKRTALSFAKTL